MLPKLCLECFWLATDYSQATSPLTFHHLLPRPPQPPEDLRLLPAGDWQNSLNSSTSSSQSLPRDDSHTSTTAVDLFLTCSNTFISC